MADAPQPGVEDLSALRHRVESVQRMNQLINDILEFSRLGTRPLEVAETDMRGGDLLFHTSALDAVALCLRCPQRVFLRLHAKDKRVVTPVTCAM